MPISMKPVSDTWDQLRSNGLSILISYETNVRMLPDAVLPGGGRHWAADGAASKEDRRRVATRVGGRRAAGYAWFLRSSHGLDGLRRVRDSVGADCEPKCAKEVCARIGGGNRGGEGGGLQHLLQLLRYVYGRCCGGNGDAPRGRQFVP